MAPRALTEPSDTRVLLGAIASAHGIRGEVVIRAFTADPADIARYGALTGRDGRAFRLLAVRVTAKGVVARIEGVADRTAAEALRGTELYVTRDKLGAPAEGEFYHADLIGCTAVDSGGATLGRIVAVQDFGAGTLLELQAAGQRQTEFIPFDDRCVPTVDIAARRVVIVRPVLTGEKEPDADGDGA